MRSFITHMLTGHGGSVRGIVGRVGRIVPLLVALLLPLLSIPTQAQDDSRHYPPLFYRGENLVTIIDPSGSGIERVSVLMSREIELRSPSGFVTGCPDSLQLRFDVGSVTTGEIAFITISTCDGRTVYDTIRAEEWTVRHECGIL